MESYTVCHTDNKLRKIDYDKGSKQFVLLFNEIKKYFNELISDKAITTIGYDKDKNEYSIYGNPRLIYKDELDKDILFIGIKIDKYRNTKRIKHYYLGNYFNLPSDKNIFLSGRYQEDGVTTLYYSLDNVLYNTIPTDTNIGNFAIKPYVGITYSQNGVIKYVTEYKKSE